MAMNPVTRRRWVGGLALAAAGVLLLVGETLLRGRLSPATFLLYWLICFAFTAFAIGIAVLDARALRRQTRREEQELLHRTLGEIEQRQHPRSNRPRAPGP